MKITFYSNFLNHHQIPFCNEMFKSLGHDFTFVATEKIPEERIQGGYMSDFSSYTYLLESYLSEDHEKKAIELGLSSDIVIIGSADDKYIKDRLKLNKLTFRYSERLFKKGFLYFFHPKVLIKRFIKDTLLRRKNVYMLSSSAYTPYDYSFYLAYPNKFLKWGYFPEFITYQKEALFKQKPSQGIHLLWAGRFLNWKRPMDAVYVFEKLIKDYPNIHLTMLGTGPIHQKVSNYISSRNLSQITLKGALKAHEVRKEMEKAHIFLLTSNKEEGWGAVLNEAMNAGCLCLSNYVVGSAPYLIKHLENGVIYKGINSLESYLRHYLNQKDEINKLSWKAYQTIESLWNPQIASTRFLTYAKALLSDNIITYEEGPLSIAPRLSERKVCKSIKKTSH